MRHESPSPLGEALPSGGDAPNSRETLAGAEALQRETTFLNAVDARLQRLTPVLDPRSPDTWLEDVRKERHQFPAGCGSDTQQAYRLFMRNGHSADETDSLLGGIPRNQARAWRVERANRPLFGPATWLNSGIVLCVASWSPLDELTRRDGRASRPGAAQDVVAVVRRLQFPTDRAVWLVLGSTTGWIGGLPASVDGQVHCCFFGLVPSDLLKVKRPVEQPPGGYWLETAVLLERADQLADQVRQWFDTQGRRQARKDRRLRVVPVAEEVGVPAWAVEQFFRGLARGDRAWSYDEARALVSYSGR